MAFLLSNAKLIAEKLIDSLEEKSRSESLRLITLHFKKNVFENRLHYLGVIVDLFIWSYKKVLYNLFLFFSYIIHRQRIQVPYL